jgi:hypothetical protein
MLYFGMGRIRRPEYLRRGAGASKVGTERNDTTSIERFTKIQQAGDTDATPHRPAKRTSHGIKDDRCRQLTLDARIVLPHG